MVTEDIDVSWKLQLKFWDIRYEPRALCAGFYAGNGSRAYGRSDCDGLRVVLKF